MSETCPVCGARHGRVMAYLGKKYAKEVVVDAGRGRIMSCWVMLCAACDSAAKPVSLGVVFPSLASFVQHMERQLPFQVELPTGTTGCRARPTAGAVIRAPAVVGPATCTNTLPARANVTLSSIEEVESPGGRFRAT